MGLYVNRRNGEAIALDLPDGSRILLTRWDDVLKCHKARTADSEPAFQWQRHIELGCTIRVEEQISVEMREPKHPQNTNSVCFVVSAPADVIISRSESIRTVDDRLRESLAS